MVEILNPEEQRVEAVEDAFLALAISIPEVESALDYRPGTYPRSLVCMLFDDEVEVAHTAGGNRGPVRVEWQWIVDIYVHGYERKEMQARMRRIILALKAKMRENRLLDRTVKKTPEMEGLGPMSPVRIAENPGLLKRYRLRCEKEIR